jgi:acetyl-CoA synthetase
VTINEFYGQTECNVVVSSCASVFAPRNGASGGAPDPVMFPDCWRNDQSTRDRFRGEWLRTGGLGTRDERGFIRFVGRDDDVIASAGYRIGPASTEDCLLHHPALCMSACRRGRRASPCAFSLGSDESFSCRA